MEELLSRVHDKISYGDSLVEMLKAMVSVDGVPKLQRKILQEVRFLKKLKMCGQVKEEQLSCSNLRHLGALVQCALRPGVVAVCKTFHQTQGGKIVIDVVSDGGRTWTKVIARNPRSLSALSHGNASFGARSILDQAEDYLECARFHPCMYQPPQVVFELTSGIEDALASRLEATGVAVRGERVPTYRHFGKEGSWSREGDDSDSEPMECEREKDGTVFKCTPAQLEITTLNLDVTTMMAYISNMTNGYCHFVFKQPILTQQAAWEAQRPVKPVIEALFKGKNLVCCDTAWEDFENIINTLGGDKEKKRAEDLRRSITIMPDNTGEDDESRATLKVRGHVRLRSKIVFNFGHRIKALTVSANEGFVRSAHQQGLFYVAFIHESRALSENKEHAATPLQS